MDFAIFWLFIASTKCDCRKWIKPKMTSVYNYTGRHRINRTIQPFNRVYENLHKVTPLTPVAHRQIRRHKGNVRLNILQ